MIPDFQFLLTVDSESTRLARLAARGDYRSDQEIESHNEFLNEVERNFRRLDLIEVDANTKSLDEIVAEILETIAHGTPPKHEQPITQRFHVA